ncbi:hypothetical protein B0H14DRAFT_3159356 [Mycena olivaceomarginata]|nr:hypothetical protein B0H14DRAFT_3159356 [Mycena olivaceomarginata]
MLRGLGITPRGILKTYTEIDNKFVSPAADVDVALFPQPSEVPKWISTARSSPAPSRRTRGGAPVAVHYTNSWLCADCSSFRFDLDKILAWRPYPANAIELPRKSDEPPHYKTPLPREYLVKWVDRSYRRTQWVPHMWLVSTNVAKLENFLADGSKVELLDEPINETTADEDNPAQFQVVVESRGSSVKPGGAQKAVAARPQDSVPDAERRIPPAWKTVDRVLDLLLWRPQKSLPKRARLRKTYACCASLAPPRAEHARPTSKLTINSSRLQPMSTLHSSPQPSEVPK